MMKPSVPQNKVQVTKRQSALTVTLPMTNGCIAELPGKGNTNETDDESDGKKPMAVSPDNKKSEIEFSQDADASELSFSTQEPYNYSDFGYF